MASASLPRRKILSAQQALDLLLDMDALDSDGGQVSFAQQLTDASLEESEMETEQEPDMPPRKMRRGTGKPCASQTAKNGTVWVEEDIGSGTPSASAHPSRFTACAGPTESAKRKITSVLQSFLCLLDKGMLLTIKECTVHQASRTEPEWKLTIHELMAFISILFVRAIMCPVGAIVDCWSENFLVPLIKETMSRDRFLSIMQHLRFDDKDTRAERVKTDRFAAISDIWTRFTKNCAESFTPGEHMTIDKQVFPTKVRCPFTQYIASKPDASKCKFGIKFLMAMDLETKYICNVSPDLGKDPSHHKGERLAENLVMSLMEPFLDDGRNVTTDSFFTSLSLSHRLLQRNTTLLGTVNKVCRELPPSAKDTAEREEFSTSVFRNGSVSLTIYTPKKKKTLCLLSSLHRDVTIGNCRKRKPNTINDYNHMKCGVDVLDQMARMYSVRAPTRRWPVAVFYNMLDLAAANAYILYKACTGWKGKKRLFLSLLAKELCLQFMQQKEMEAERKAAAAFASVVAGPIQTTQCQVQESCNRNRSRFICATCQKFTCAKCREDSHWVCKRCDNRQKDRLYVRVTLKKKATKSPKKAVKPAAAKKATKSPKKAVKPAAANATKSPKKAVKPATAKATKSPKKAVKPAAAKATKSPKKAVKPAAAKKATKSPKKAVKPAAAKKATKSPKKAKAAKPCIKLTFK